VRREHFEAFLRGFEKHLSQMSMSEVLRRREGFIQMIRLACKISGRQHYQHDEMASLVLRLRICLRRIICEIDRRY
jgi:hypothetical protein